VVQIIRLAPDSKGDSRPVSGRSLPLAATPAHAPIQPLMLLNDGCKHYISRVREISLTSSIPDLILSLIKMKGPLGPWRRKPPSTPSRRSARKPGSTCSDSSSQSVLKAYRQASLPSAWVCFPPRRFDHAAQAEPATHLLGRVRHHERPAGVPHRELLRPRRALQPGLQSHRCFQHRRVR